MKLLILLSTFLAASSGNRRAHAPPDELSRLGDIILTRSAHTISSTGSCTAANGDPGKCVIIDKCPSILELTHKANRTIVEYDVLRRSTCGYDEDIPKVCCPNPCYTPYGEQGKCVRIYSCPHLSYTNDTLLAQQSRCEGNDINVCCGPPPESIPKGECDSKITAFPPDPRSKCCGLHNNKDTDQYPWLAVIEYFNRENRIRLICGGTLISNRYVLTAAHCLVGSVLNVGVPKSIRFGEYDTAKEGYDCATVEDGRQECTDGVTFIPIEQTIVHAGYNHSAKEHAIGLIRLKYNAPYTDFIRPICLPVTDVSVWPPPQLMLYVAGWGGSTNSQTVKHHVRLPFVRQGECQSAYNVTRNKATVSRDHICAGGDVNKNACLGRGGYPLMYENEGTYEIVGIDGFGPMCQTSKPFGVEGVPDVYTKVHQYLSWIRSNIKP